VNFFLLPSEGYTLEYETGWYEGTAGIGLFLLELHDRAGTRSVLAVNP